MENNFIKLDYLLEGSLKQKLAYNVLEKIDIFNILREFNPILVGTIPIGIDIDNSDLDIICEVYDLKSFEEIIRDNFSSFSKFKIKKLNENTLVVSFWSGEFEIEIYAQNIKTVDQNGYRHMIVENRILSLGGDLTIENIIKLKKKGLKTEPAFAKILNLEGNPYEELLKVENLSDEEIKKVIERNILKYL